MEKEINFQILHPNVRTLLQDLSIVLYLNQLADNEDLKDENITELKEHLAKLQKGLIKEAVESFNNFEEVAKAQARKNN